MRSFERPIQSVTIEHRRHRVREFLSKLVPGLVSAPKKIGPNTLIPGDRLVLPDGTKRHVSIVIPSAEGTRYAFSDRLLPREVGTQHETQQSEEK
jgi:hypothetical protein